MQSVADELRIAEQYWQAGYKRLTNGRPGRGQLMAFLRYLVLGQRVGRLLYHARYIQEQHQVPVYSQCRYRWRLVGLGLAHVQRGRKGQWLYQLQWARLHQLAVLGGYDGTLEQLTQLVRVQPEAQYETTRQELLETSADALLSYYPNPGRASRAQIVRALRWATTQYGTGALSDILSAACKIAREKKHPHPPPLLRFLYHKTWALIAPATISKLEVAAQSIRGGRTPNTTPPNRDELINAFRQLYHEEPDTHILQTLLDNPVRALRLVHAPSLFQKQYPTPQSITP